MILIFIIIQAYRWVFGLQKLQTTDYVNFIKRTTLNYSLIPTGISLGILLKVISSPDIKNLGDGLIMAAALTNFLSNTSITERYRTHSWKFGFIYNFFFFLTLVYVQTNSILSLFIIYELFLLPSAVLIVLFNPGKRGLETAKHFLVWTQTGSMLVFFGVWYITSYFGATSFTCPEFNYNKLPLTVQLMLVIGFLIKIPSYPFYFWLLKTHVESVTSFSIFLSGFLVKIALFGLYKFFPLLSYPTRVMAICLLFSGGIASSAAIFKQSDFKKMVAYTTVQEMAQLTMILFVLGPSNSALAGHFIVVHGLLSALFFFISETLYKIFKSRCVFSFNGLMIVAPKASILLVTAVTLFKGLPFTSKNKVEFNILDALMNLDYALLVTWLILIIFIGNIAITYVSFKILVFNPPINKGSSDVTYFEFMYTTLVLTMLVLVMYIKI